MKKNAVIFALAAGLAYHSHAAAIWTETFTYPDGSLTNVSGGLWTTHSGTGTPILISGNQVAGMSAGGGSREDSNRLLDATYSTGVLFAGFDMSLSSTPVGSAYFLHFKDATVSGFRGRVFAAAPTSAGFRLGLENDSSDGGGTIMLTGDLTQGTVYRVILAYDTGAGTSRLWVNNTTEAAPDLQDTVAAGLLPITSVGLRQGATAPAAYTDLNIDNLIIATDFASAVPEPSALMLFSFAGLASLLLLRRKLG